MLIFCSSWILFYFILFFAVIEKYGIGISLFLIAEIFGVNLPLCLSPGPPPMTYLFMFPQSKKKKCPCLSFYTCEMGFLKPKLSELLAVLENILRVQALLVWHSAEVTVWSRGTGSPWPCPWLTQESFRTFLVSFSLGHTVLHPISSSTPSNPSCPPQPVKTIVQSNLFPKKF